MGSELLRIAEGFSIVAEGLRGLAKAEGGSAKDKSVKEQKQDAAKAQLNILTLRSHRFIA